MESFKGTKEKWELRPISALNENGNPLYYDVCIGNQTFISTFNNASIGCNDEIQLANAKAVVCVPEMLEMLEDVLSYLDSGQKAEAEEMLFHKIKELIKKATT